MSDLDSLIANAAERLDALEANAAQASEIARLAEMALREHKAYQSGLLAARAAAPLNRARTRVSAGDSPQRSRSLSGPWKQILQHAQMDAPFDYGDLETAAKAVGHPTTRESLRSQMSLYKSRGFVEAQGNGSFDLTDAGKMAISSGQREASEPKPFGGSDFADDLGDVPF